MVQDLSLDLCVVSAPHRTLETLGADTNDSSDEAWDHMMVDTHKRLVMVSGERFRQFMTDPKHDERSDAARGLPLEQVFSRSIVDIVGPLIDAVLDRQADSAQLHTIFRSHNLTLFAFLVRNDAKKPIGVMIQYRPTRYDRSDIAKLISSGSKKNGSSESGDSSGSGYKTP